MMIPSSLGLMTSSPYELSDILINSPDIPVHGMESGIQRVQSHWISWAPGIVCHELSVSAKALYKALGINIGLTTAYHPAANGQVKRKNQDIEQFLRFFVSQ